MITIGLEYRFLRDTTGRVWAKTQCDEAFWRKYTEVLGNINIVARIREVSEKPEDYLRSDGPGIDFKGIRDYHGPASFLRYIFPVIGDIVSYTKDSSLLILRTPGLIENVMYLVARARHIPFAVEVVGDPQEVFANNGAGGRVAPLYELFFTSMQRWMCRDAEVVSYVTGETLQKKYPNSAGREHAVSDVYLPDEAFLPEPRHFKKLPSPLSMVMVGSLEVPYKGVDVALRALSKIKNYVNATLTIVGDGVLRLELEAMAHSLGLQQQVRFLGALPAGEAVRKELRQADLFLMPSRTEGMPRALLEAMALGLPALASRVGGIPEVLGEDYLFTSEQPDELAALLMLLTPEKLGKMSSENLQTARKYHLSNTTRAHREFLREVKALMAENK
ncbi:glycosyltransferase family 1 protein [Deinococcus metallilatus]|uniref:Glycosyltransferase family 4 protein n=1 Tax=Deinococcus metallilatus TaxID=1211322 RepID=A0AAJ5F0Q3_9DEIO|nr:glycosyltransferase family 4 protein [Deinococcus metallilatus]MBB5297038.1 glycosyltransferase involved in cell wall biosynthesis [Deinococcus metallilatus]QBY07833.1 glycosyltransferase family 1 protein [Deinococcus metallilatus]RXJ13182.1 glycosyltransferase family 1 protein [Deinococcus metallilatus]TLK23045.1 glycosyltransferase family 4 protein [Deinococcus metallilatus]GMA16004.1 hypothetical protein GCM10025871_23350 [Deinococcus metallilatus]